MNKNKIYALCSGDDKGPHSLDCGIDHSLDFCVCRGVVTNKYLKYFVAIMTRLQPYGHVHGAGPKVKQCINK
jgi:hypothetical protein